MSFSQRTLNFHQPGEFGFGFPGAHLLAIRYLPAGLESRLKDEMHFYFTTKVLVVQGHNLEQLYLSLLLGNQAQGDKPPGEAQPPPQQQYCITGVYPRDYVTGSDEGSEPDDHKANSTKNHKAETPSG